MIVDFNVVLGGYLMLSNNLYFHVIFLLILTDILTGYSKAFITGQLNSQRGMKGLLKHALSFFIVTNIYVYATLIGFEWVALASVIVLCISYGISILENLDAMGIWIPKFLKDKLLQFRESIDRGDGIGKTNRK